MIRVDALSAASSGIQTSLQRFDTAAQNVVVSAIAPPAAPAVGVQPAPAPAASNGQPAIDIGGELVNMMVAQTGVAANVVVVQQAVDTYRDLLAMTNSDRSRLAASAPVSAA